MFTSVSEYRERSKKKTRMENTDQQRNSTDGVDLSVVDVIEEVTSVVMEFKDAVEWKKVNLQAKKDMAKQIFTAVALLSSFYWCLLQLSIFWIWVLGHQFVAREKYAPEMRLFLVVQGIYAIAFSVSAAKLFACQWQVLAAFLYYFFVIYPNIEGVVRFGLVPRNFTQSESIGTRIRTFSILFTQKSDMYPKGCTLSLAWPSNLGCSLEAAVVGFHFAFLCGLALVFSDKLPFFMTHEIWLQVICIFAWSFVHVKENQARLDMETKFEDKTEKEETQKIDNLRTDLVMEREFPQKEAHGNQRRQKILFMLRENPKFCFFLIWLEMFLLRLACFGLYRVDFT